ncbi:MAG: regulatory protein RecX [Cohaesibacteraceae bacterium]|nr:regulatory protein RecX [Cohaesibacteraceae bacterium]MBL4876918.1 regulatory protein RecX [Cohaesibacteraceae bacterium]
MKSRKSVKKVTESYLENVARFYLDRFSATEKGLQRYLTQKVNASAREYDTDPADGKNWIEILIVTLREQGYLNDGQYALSRSRSRLRKGNSLRAIAQDLKFKGVPEKLAQDAISALKVDHSDPDLKAALLYARRRRLGPYRLPEARDINHDKDLAALARRGFGFELIQKILRSTGIEQLEDEAKIFDQL